MPHYSAEFMFYNCRLFTKQKALDGFSDGKKF